eukprot:TRINITY_DN121306_c0_g1_i1.p1 TRINITY_DN121306_c0_g1~~TRINITY_DN121306_c0_g1_i1.p1  ORF type:complete len:320 (+),score=52.63 TRINITY_DN121306_c0_g1_i1:92-961(+)
MGGPCTVDGRSRPELDNFYKCSVEVDGVVWPSSEHCYQGSKFPTNQEMQEKIRTSASAMDSWKIGNSCRDLREDWEIVKVRMMYMANRAKFQQSQFLRDLLTTSEGPITAQGGLYWKTWNEILLERIREELRPFDECNRKVLVARTKMMEALEEAAKTGDQRRIEAVTVHASKRQLPPSAAEMAKQKVTVRSPDEKLDWLADTEFKADMLTPEVNGQPHYMNKEGWHLYLGSKHGNRAWCIDEVLSPGEVSGTSFVKLSDDSDGRLPRGKTEWQCFTGSRHEPKQLMVN